METLKKDETLEEDYEVLKDYGFNVDYLMDLLNNEEIDED